MPAAPQIRRLNWGCGSWTSEGWVNCDLKADPGVDVTADAREGLPFPDGSFDYVVSIHALPELHVAEVVPVLSELRRVLRPGGVLRLGLPDLDRTIAAYLRRDTDFFLVPDEDATSLGAKFILHTIWFGYSRTLFNFPLVREMLGSAGYASIGRCGYRQTRSGHPDIVALDNREDESLFVEAAKEM